MTAAHAYRADAPTLPTCSRCNATDAEHCPHCDACPPQSAAEPTCCLYGEGADDLGQWGGEYVRNPEYERWINAQTLPPVKVPAGMDVEEDRDVTF